jgi:hypothetical protein
VAENRLGSSTRDWRLSLDLRPEVVPRDQEEEEEDVYEDLSVFSSYAKPREDVSSCTVKKVRDFSVLSREVTNQTLPGRE